jgi:hypothetical protein
MEFYFENGHKGKRPNSYSGGKLWENVYGLARMFCGKYILPKKNSAGKVGAEQAQ